MTMYIASLHRTPACQQDWLSFLYWVSHHLIKGFRKLFVAFDTPFHLEDTVTGLASSDPRFGLVLDKDRVALSLAPRGSSIPVQQALFVDSVMLSLPTGAWVLHIDADELYHGKVGPGVHAPDVEDEDDAKAIIFQNWEAVLQDDQEFDDTQCIFHLPTLFRHPARAAYANGKSAGKCVPGNRTCGVHRFCLEPQIVAPASHAVILHFECMTRAQWRRKFETLALEFTKGCLHADYATFPYVMDSIKDVMSTTEAESTSESHSGSPFTTYRTASGHAVMWPVQPLRRVAFLHTAAVHT
jgi:hypothetical protein